MATNDHDARFSSNRINRESLLISSNDEGSELIRHAVANNDPDEMPSMKLSDAVRLIKNAFMGRKWTDPLDL